jgi:hypothetical protein
LVQFLLGLARAGIRTTLGWRGAVVAAATSASGIAAGRACGALAWNVTVDVFRSGFGDVATMSTAAAAATATVCVVVRSGAQAAGVAGPLDAIHQAGSGEVGGVEGIAFTAARDERKADGLALGVGAIVFLNRCVCVFETSVCDVSNSFGAARAVVGKSEIGDGSNAAKKVLLGRETCQKLFLCYSQV